MGGERLSPRYCWRWFSGGAGMAEPLRTLIPGTLRIGTYFQLRKRTGGGLLLKCFRLLDVDSPHSRRDLGSMHLHRIDFVCLQRVPDPFIEISRAT